MFFHPGFLGFKSIGFLWFLSQIALVASTVKFLRKILLCIYPFSVFLPIVATLEWNEIIGFAFLKVKKRLSAKGFLAELGIIVSDDHQGKGVGSKLMEVLLKLAREENIREIVLTVLSDNIRAIRLYEKYGFKRVGQTVDIWMGKKFRADIVRLSL